MDAVFLPANALPVDPGVPGAYALLLLDVVARWGIAAPDLLQPLNLQHSDLLQPQCRLSAQQLNALLMQALHWTGEATLAYQLGAQMRISTHGFIGFAVMTAGTVGQAAELVSRFVSVRMPYAQVQWVAGHHNVGALVIDLNLPLEPLRREILLAMCIGLTLMARTLLDRPLQGELRFPYARPGGFERYQPWLDLDILFDQPVCRLTFFEVAIDTPIKMADPVASQLALQQCEAELQQLGWREGVAAQVRQRLMQWPQGFPDLAALAASLHLSERTLKRQLAAEHTSFSALLEQARHRRALALLGQLDVSIDSIATQLGYADAAVFIRAFRRWTGVTPARWRRNMPA